MRNSLYALLAAAVAPAGLSAATTLLDFESEAQRAALPCVTQGVLRAGCERKDAIGGSWSYVLRADPWKPGTDEWPGIDIPLAVSDWREYDRLVIDVLSLGESDDDDFALFICGPDGRIQNGYHALLPLVSGGFERWEIKLGKWPKTCDGSAIGRLHPYFTRPKGCEVHIDNITLYRKGETVPPPSPMLQAMKASGERASVERRLERQRARHEPAFAAFAAACADKGQASSAFLLGEATSMEKILPRGAKAPRALDPSAGLSVRLARGERESVQLFVAARDGDLREVGVEASDLRQEGGGGTFAASNVACRVVGYVETFRTAPYRTTVNVPTNVAPGYATTVADPEVGWWPDPILEYLDRTDVKGKDVQGFWIRVNCPRDQRAGTYRGKLRVSGTKNGKAESTEVPFAVRVNGFAVPRSSPLPLAITFSPMANTQHESEAQCRKVKELRENPEAPMNVWRRHKAEWGDFLADYYITMDNLYHHSDGKEDDARIYFDVLQRLHGQGRLGPFNLGYWSYPQTLDEADKAKWRESTLGRIRACYDRARELGILDKAYIYGCDEISSNMFANVRWAAEELKRAFPGVPISTTAYDHEFGVNSPLSMIDWFTPLTPKFDMTKAAASRREGHQVWWYICCGPHAPHANMFIECPAIEGRLLMGAQTAKYRPDGFLYYEITIWNVDRPISGKSAFTGWTARSWTNYNGDGSWTCCGPDGTPLPTVRLENFRDGLEDYAYVLELERRLKAHPDATWAAEARRLIAVPDSVTASLKQFTDDPSAVYRWRDRIADLIDAL